MTSSNRDPKLEIVWEKLMKAKALATIGYQSMTYEERGKIETSNYVTLLEVIAEDIKQAIAILDS